jgi:hypothetical protein
MATEAGNFILGRNNGIVVLKRNCGESPITPVSTYSTSVRWRHPDTSTQISKFGRAGANCGNFRRVSLLGGTSRNVWSAGGLQEDS